MSAPAATASSSPRAPLLPIFLIVFVDVLGLTIVYPLLPIYAERFGASAMLAALLIPTYAACQLLSGPVLGNLSDRLGRRPVLLVSQAGTCLGFLMIAQADSLWLLFAGRVLDGLTAGNLTVAQAYIADNTEPKDRARSFGVIGIAFGFGFMLGPALAGYLGHIAVRLPLYAAASLSATSFVCTLLLLRREGPRNADPQGLPAGKRPSVFAFKGYAPFFRRPIVGGILLEFFLYQAAFSIFMAGFALYAERRFHFHGVAFSTREIGASYAFGGFVGAIIQGGLFGRMVKRFGERRLVVWGLVSLGVGYAAMGYVQPVLPLAVALTFGAFGNSLLRPSLTSALSQVVAREEQGVALGLSQSLASLANVSAAPLSGWLIERMHLVAWGWVAAGACALALVAGRWGSGLTPAHPPSAGADASP